MFSTLDPKHVRNKLIFFSIGFLVSTVYENEQTKGSPVYPDELSTWIKVVLGYFRKTGIHLGNVPARKAKKACSINKNTTIFVLFLCLFVCFLTMVINSYLTLI